MRRFNLEKELNKIQYGDRNKLIGTIVFLLVIIAVGSTYALYQVRHTQKLVFNTVGEFKKRDIILSVLVDGETKSEFPGKEDGYVFDNIICDKPGIEASFNNETWKLTLTTGTTNKCTVKFITKPYMDGSGANYPDLFQGLIPIRYDQGKIYIADYQQKWYDYNNNEWANAVLIDHNNPEVMNKFYTDGKLNVNTEITTDDILQMYVWIPRYKYELFNVGLNGTPKQIINIKFENTIETTGEVSCTIDNTGKEACINAENGNWYTHPAFTFGDTELRGIWVGKFEPSDPTDLLGNQADVINEITILPNKTAMVSRRIGIIFDATRNIELQNTTKYNLKQNEIDTHLMKNSEWGAVAYLSQSIYGIYKDNNKCNIEGMVLDECEIWINNTHQGIDGKYGGTATGCVGETSSAYHLPNSIEDSPAVCNEDKQWNTANGVKASTTGTIYGIYDMNGGDWETLMGVLVDDEKTNIFSITNTNGFNGKPDKKYYDLYNLGTSERDYQNGHLGDATREILSTTKTNGWNSDIANMIYINTAPFITRSGTYTWNTRSGIFCFSTHPGSRDGYGNSRIVLTAQDGED